MEAPNQHNYMGVEAFLTPQLGSFGVFLTLFGGLRVSEGCSRAMGWQHTTGGHSVLSLLPASIFLSTEQATLMTISQTLDVSQDSLYLR